MGVCFIKFKNDPYTTEVRTNFGIIQQNLQSGGIEKFIKQGF